MANRLRDNINSQYIEAANALRGKQARRRIAAYVESYDDVYFWRTVLSRFEDDKRYFEVMLPSKARLTRGKKSVLMNFLTDNRNAVNNSGGNSAEAGNAPTDSSRLGRDMIACVDADYDYLLQGVTDQSRRVIESPYVFHTYVYAIENYQCFAPSLHDVCVAVTLNDHMVFNIEEYLREYSQAIFPLFVWSIWHYRRDCYKEFTISDFCTVIETGNFTIQKAPEILQRVRRKVGTRVAQLQREHPDAKESYLEVKESLKQLGVTADTTYLYIQGHHLFNNVVVPMLKKVCSQLVNERQSEITRQSLHSQQRHNELSCYTKSIGDIESTLKKNLGYMLSDPFQRILADVAKIFPANNKTQNEEEKEEAVW